MYSVPGMLPVVSNELRKVFIRDSESFAALLVTGVVMVGCFKEVLGCLGTASPLGRVWVC